MKKKDIIKDIIEVICMTTSLIGAFCCTDKGEYGFATWLLGNAILPNIKIYAK